MNPAEVPEGFSAQPKRTDFSSNASQPRKSRASAAEPKAASPPPGVDEKASAAAAPDSDVSPLSLEEALGRLEAIVRHLEEGEPSLDEALARYEEGVRLLRHCYNLLEKAERRIELLSGVDAQGNPVFQPFEDRALSLEEKAKTRDLRRTAPPTVPPSAEGKDRSLPNAEGLF